MDVAFDFSSFLFLEDLSAALVICKMSLDGSSVIHLLPILPGAVIASIIDSFIDEGFDDDSTLFFILLVTLLFGYKGDG